MSTQKLTPFIWFEKGAEEAAKFYCSVFKNSKVLDSNPMVTSLELDGLRLNIFNGGPHFRLNEAFSLVISCDTQEEIDHYWNKLTADGGEESRCGWCKDKYGLWWQVIPSALPKLMSDPARARQVTEAFLKMKKFDLKQIMEA
jgi:predicted 3-demethylubiquinone-9 3-methyltransferase (glyoxalase superfamily)